MIKNQKNKYTMYESVSAYLGKNSSVFEENEEFKEHFNSFRTSLIDIELKEDQRNKATKGRTTDKNISRETVTEEALGVAGALYAMAKKNGDVALRESVNLSKSKLKNFRDAGLMIELNSIKEKAVENSSEISRYGISPDKLAKYIDLITSYENALGARYTGGATRSGASKSLLNLFREADSTLDSIDRLMENYKVRNTEFYNGFKSSRVIKDLGIRRKEQGQFKGPDKDQNPVQGSGPEQS